ncbi:MAG TPA: hypothetical protein VMF06_00710 [Candidatus Limnocylindria bacterium]|nr:hypothetical protein [Candidatus Limnocylindria bacterium]
MSLVWVALLELLQGGNTALLVWPVGFWLAFPVGAVLGGRSLNRFRSHDFPSVIGKALVFGLLTGLLLTVVYWTAWAMPELIGLIKNANGGGYESYRFSVLKGFRETAWRMARTILPVSAGVVVLWEISRSLYQRRRSEAETAVIPTPKVRLKLGWPHLIVGLINSGVMLLIMCFFYLKGPLAVKDVGWGLLGSLAVPLLGPWIGPFIGSNWYIGNAVAWSWVAAPVLLAALTPFVLRVRVRRPVATLSWVAFISAMLFWWCAGMISAAGSMG